MQFWLLIVLFIMSASTAYSQGNEFIIEGRFKIDGGSNSGSKIVVEKDGRKVKTLEDESRFEIDLDYQAIYVISFMKEGFVTKRIRFDTHVPESRIEYGFEPFPFEVEIFEQYDDVNMVVFNQPVGKISYSELLDDFDYDTDYTKSIQSQLDQAQKDVEDAKEKKQVEQEKSAQEVANLTKDAEKSAKSGNYDRAISNFEEALKLKKDPEIEKRINELKTEKEQKEKKEEFNKVVEEADAAMANGDLDGAKKLYEKANGVMGGDSKVTARLAEIESQKAQQKQQEQAFSSASQAAKDALAAGDFAEAVEKAEQALKIKADPALEKLIADAKQGQEEAEAKAKAEAEMEEEYEALVAEADKAFDAGDFEAAAAKYEEAKQLKATPELDEKLKSVSMAVAQMEEEKRKQEEQQAQLEGALSSANAALAEGNLDGAKSALEEAKGLGTDERISEIEAKIAEQEEQAAEKAAAEAEKEKAVADKLTSAESSLAAGELDDAEAFFNEAKALGAEESVVNEGIKKIEEKRAELLAAEEQRKAKEAEAKEQLDALISEAEALIEQENFDEASSKLTEASQISSDKRISELQKVIKEKEEALAKAQAEKAEEAKAYQTLIDEGNALLAEQKLDKAEKAFTDAKEMSLEDVSAANTGLAAVDDARKAQAAQAEKAAEEEKQAAYMAKVDAGNSALEDGELTTAEEAFKAAMELSDSPTEAESGLTAVKEARAVQKAKAEAEAADMAAAEKEEKYKALIDEGNESLEAGELTDAEDAFNNATSLKDNPAEAEAGLLAVAQKRESDKAAEAKRMAEAAAAEKEAMFSDKVSEGDKAFDAEDFDAAQTAYEEALKIKEDDHVTKQLSLIEEKTAALLAAEQEQSDLEAQKESERLEKEKAEKEAAEAAEAQRLAEEQAKRKAEEEALKNEENDAEVEALEVQKAEEERRKAEAAAALAAKKEAFDKLVEQGDIQLKANELDKATASYSQALELFPDNADVKKKIQSIADLKRKLAEEKEKSKQAAMAMTDQRGRESEQLAKILEEEEAKAKANEIIKSEEPNEPKKSAPKSVRMAQPVVQEEAAPGSTMATAVVISESKVGNEARKTQTAQLTDEEIYDGIQNRVEEQQQEFMRDKEQERLMNAYKDRKTVETETVGKSEVTWVYINNGKFITVYKKVVHNWGGVYYFIDGRSTNQRFWEHETQ